MAVTVLYLIWYTIVIIVHLSYKRWNLFTVGPMYWWPPKKGFPQVRYKINALLQIRYGCLSKNHHHTQVLTCDLRILNSNKIRNLFTVAPMYRWSLKRGFLQSKYKRNVCYWTSVIEILLSSINDAIIGCSHALEDQNITEKDPAYIWIKKHILISITNLVWLLNVY